MLFLCVSFLKSLGGFLPDPDDSRVAALATWWGIPFGLCFWTLASVAIARETEQAGTGSPAEPERQWRWLIRLRETTVIRATAYVVLFGGTIAFTIIGSIPGLIWQTVVALTRSGRNSPSG